MRTDFLDAMRCDPPSEMIMSLRERLRTIERTEARRASRARRNRYLAVAASIVMLVGLLTVPTIGSNLWSFLDLFRDRSLAEVRLDPSSLARLRPALGDRSPALLIFETSRDTSESRHVYGSVEEASGGVVPPAAPFLADRYGVERVEVTTNRVLHLEATQERVEWLFDALDFSEVRVPRGIADGDIDIRVPRTTTVRYTTPDGALEHSVYESPTIEVSPGLDLEVLAELGLRIAGMQPAAAHELAEETEWRMTLLATLPEGSGVFQSIDLSGSRALLVAQEADEGRERETTLIWTRDGSLHVLHGPGSALISVARQAR